MDITFMSAEESEALADMNGRMAQLRQAIISHDYKWAESIYDYLATKASEYKDYSDDVYDIVTCSDFAYDVMKAMEMGECDVDQLLDQYDRLFNPDSLNYRDFSSTDNVIHDSGSYTGPGA